MLLEKKKVDNKNSNQLNNDDDKEEEKSETIIFEFDGLTPQNPISQNDLSNSDNNNNNNIMQVCEFLHIFFIFIVFLGFAKNKIQITIYKHKCILKYAQSHFQKTKQKNNSVN